MSRFCAWVFLVVMLVLVELQDKGVFGAALLLKGASNCPGAPNPMPMPMEVKILKNFPNNTQLIDFTLTIPFPVHTNTLAIGKIERNTLGSWIPLVKVEDKKGMCNLFTMNGKEMWEDVQKQVGLPLNTCPLPAGTYHTNHIMLYLTNQKIPGVPPGSYRATLEVREKSSNRVLLCKMFDLDDKAN